ncbi:B12-binding domain-containing radical SAM protein [Streptomyces sp. NBC_01429]|uniref:B12-binding domain-containing radical SAM protein n=1 Tax=Streptomyces sp. NBC_01429 TaxID=2903862 RepID=UPI002E2B909C|nr:radical SAM protein [Streptomyces sp. NBC_01429]
MTDVLVIWPPHVPSYFNAGHHSPLYMVAGHLRRQPGTGRVDTCEAGTLSMNWKGVGDLLYQGSYDVIAVMNDFDAVDGLARFTEYARVLSPQSRLITFGRLSSLNPGYFRQFDLDAVVQSGDYETGVALYVNSLVKSGPEIAPVAGFPGVAVRGGEGWLEPDGRGQRLAPEEWSLPDVDEIPYQDYDRFYAKDEHKFCGIPFRRELVVPAARGCPVGCEFCEVPEIFGLRERRMPVDAVIDYIRDSYARHPFEYVAFYAPTFTLDRRWVRELCERFIEGPVSPQWKCATTIHHLGEELVALMGRAGCVRISVGLETLEPDGQDGLPRNKRIEEERFGTLARWCDAAGIELNAFVIVGLPGTTIEGTSRTFEFARSLGARVRPTMYTPFHEMTADMTTHEVARFNRQLISGKAVSAEDGAGDGSGDGSGDGDTGTGAGGGARPEADARYGFMFGREDRLTSVHERIPQRTTR